MRIQKSGRKRGGKGNGVGCHHEVSPMGHATRTKTRVEKQRIADRKQKQRGWQ